MSWVLEIESFGRILGLLRMNLVPSSSLVAKASQIPNIPSCPSKPSRRLLHLAIAIVIETSAGHNCIQGPEPTQELPKPTSRSYSCGTCLVVRKKDPWRQFTASVIWKYTSIENQNTWKWFRKHRLTQSRPFHGFICFIIYICGCFTDVSAVRTIKASPSI